jgi:hypothetical protein
MNDAMKSFTEYAAQSKKFFYTWDLARPAHLSCAQAGSPSLLRISFSSRVPHFLHFCILKACGFNCHFLIPSWKIDR